MSLQISRPDSYWDHREVPACPDLGQADRDAFSTKISLNFDMEVFDLLLPAGKLKENKTYNI